MRVLGDYSGGRLFWFPDDDGSLCPESLDMNKAVYPDMSDFISFDENCIHGVEDFDGERISVIFFSTITGQNADAGPSCRLLKDWQQ